MAVKPLTIACDSPAAADLLAREYAHIGRTTRRDGRFLTITTR